MKTSTDVMRDYHRVSSKIKFLEARKAMNTGPQTIRDYRRIEAVIRFLEGRSVLATAYETGLSGPGRLHDLFVAVEAVTPGEYKEFGEDVEIRYGFAPSPFGDCLIAVTGRELRQPHLWIGRWQDRAHHAVSQGDELSDQGLASATSNSSWDRSHVRGARRCDRSTHRRPSGGQRGGINVFGSVPPNGRSVLRS